MVVGVRNRVRENPLSPPPCVRNLQTDGQTSQISDMRRRAVIDRNGQNVSTVCPRSSDPFYKVTYYIKWVTTSWTESGDPFYIVPY